MAAICFIRTQNNINHLCIVQGQVELGVGPTNNEDEWRLIPVPNQQRGYQIQNRASGRFIQIFDNAVNLREEPDENCNLTLSNGIGNNTKIQNLNDRNHDYVLGRNGRMVTVVEGQDVGERWNIAP